MRFVPRLPVSDNITGEPSSSPSNLEASKIGEKPSQNENSANEYGAKPAYHKPATRRHRIPLLQLPLPAKSTPSEVCAAVRVWNSKWSQSILQGRQIAGNCLQENNIPRKSTWISRSMSRTLSLSSCSSKSSSRTISKCGGLVTFNEMRNVIYNPDPERILDDEYFDKAWWNSKDRVKCIKRRNREIHQLLTLEENESYRKAVLTVTKFCHSYPESMSGTHSKETNTFKNFKDVHRAIGVLVTSRCRGLERIVSKSLQIQENQVRAIGFMKQSDETVDNTSAAYIRKCVLTYHQQLCSSVARNYLDSNDARENNLYHQSDEAMISLASYCQSLEQQSRSVLWAQLMATGDAAVVAAFTKRCL